MFYYDVVIQFEKAAIAAIDSHSWHIDFYDVDRQPLYRVNQFDKDFRAGLVDGGRTMNIRIGFSSQREPVLWKVHPYTAQEWLTPFEGASARGWAHVRRTAPWVLMDGRSVAARDTPRHTGSAA